MHITNTSKPIVATKILLNLMDAQFGSSNGKHFGSSIRRGANASVLRVSDATEMQADIHLPHAWNFPPAHLLL
jgi:hypothetical protein